MKSTERFTSRVENYIKYRPSYPADLLQLLRTESGMGLGAVVADIGSGTGILTKQLLDAGNRVYGVEPNKEMRQAAEALLAGYPNFRSIDATAENTTLPTHSIDLITAGQAFHWFDPVRARAEFARILKPGGLAALIWNQRKEDASPFLAEYDQMLRTHCPEYEEIRHQRIEHEQIGTLFGSGGYTEAEFDNSQLFDYEGLKGRLLSSSYTPEPDHPNHDPLLKRLRELFDEHEQAGYVAIDYRTQVYYGQITEGP